MRSWVEYAIFVAVSLLAVVGAAMAGQRGPDADDHGDWRRFSEDEPPIQPVDPWGDFLDPDELTEEEQELEYA
jgi:hypothetical protein